MKLARPSRADDGSIGSLPLTSLIDVVFLLLIFFLVTTSMAPPESELASAIQSERAGAGAAADLQPQVLRVEVEGDSVVYRMGERAMHGRDELAALLRELPRASGVIVRVSNRAPVEAAATALQCCKDAGFDRVSYVPGS